MSGSVPWLLIFMGAILVLILIIFAILANISYIYIALSKKNEVQFKEVFSKARGIFWKYVGFAIVITLFLFGLFLLFIVPGIIFMIFWILAPYILIHENKRIMDSLKTSKELVEGRWWRLFGYFLFLMVIIIVVSVLTGFIPIIGDLVQYLVITPFSMIFFKNLYLDLKKNSVKKK